MFYKIFATLLMFSILMICLAQNSTEEPADTANPFIAQLSERLRPVWRLCILPMARRLSVEGRTAVLRSMIPKTVKKSHSSANGPSTPPRNSCVFSRW